MEVLRRGSEISVTTALFAFVCWGLWDFDNRDSPQVNLILSLVVVLLVAVGLFVLCRFIGRLVISGWLHRVRRSARLSHLAVGVYLVVCGISFLERVSWFDSAYNAVIRWIG
jgi:threonine/homoserine/homoserine lactone efflux protein